MMKSVIYEVIAYKSKVYCVNKYSYTLRAISLLKIKSKGKKTICDFKKYEANLSVHNQPPLRRVRRLVPNAQSERFNGAISETKL